MIDGITQQADRHDWTPKPTSDIALEWTRPPLGDVPESESPLRWGYQAAQHRMRAARDQLDALERLMVVPMSIFGPATVTRSAIEASARVHWLCDPDIDINTRVARHVLERLEGMDWHSWRTQEDEVQQMRRELREEFEHRVKVAFDLEVTRNRRGRLMSVADASIPTWTELVNRLLTGEGDPGRALYQQLAGIAHGQTFALRDFIIRGDEVREVELGHEAFGVWDWQVRLLAGCATAGTGRAMLELSDRAGWGSHRGIRHIRRAILDAAEMMTI